MASNLDLVRKSAKQNYDELLALLKQTNPSFNVIDNTSVTNTTNYDLFWPALKWIIHAQVKGLDTVDPIRGKIKKVHSLIH